MSQKLLSHPKSRAGPSLSQVSSLCLPGPQCDCMGQGLDWAGPRDAEKHFQPHWGWHSSSSEYMEINVRSSWTNVIDVPTGAVARPDAACLSPAAPAYSHHCTGLWSSIISKPSLGDHQPIITPLAIKTSSGIALRLLTVFSTLPGFLGRYFHYFR